MSRLLYVYDHTQTAQVRPFAVAAILRNITFDKVQLYLRNDFFIFCNLKKMVFNTGGFQENNCCSVKTLIFSSYFPVFIHLLEFCEGDTLYFGKTSIL